MPTYQAPIRDMQFVLYDLWQMDAVWQSLPAFAEIDREMCDAVLTEAAKFNENELFPLNQIGEQQGCQLIDGEVKTPAGFAQAYQHFVAGGWPALSGDVDFGGQGLPHSISALCDEMLCASNVSFHLYPNLTQGVARALGAHGNDRLKQTYLPKMISGEWTGAMCLTEPHCGTDLGLLRTKAEAQADGSYHITGTKIFITAGDHDLTDNIIHIVLARTPDAPAGVKGISLFLVPKFQVNDDDSLGARNAFHCSALEHKMGIKGSATCVINYDKATGYLVGELNQGMRAMFTVMNIERLAIGIQGLGLAEIAYQNSLAYAKEREQGRAPASEQSADPLIVHPDIRRMLLQQKAFIEGARALAAWVYKAVDISEKHQDDSKRAQASAKVALLTPVVKAYFSDQGFIQCNNALQILGGHGYISEWGIEQYVRDARIAQIYEGANGIQALDLLGRKILADQGQAFAAFIAEVQMYINQQSQNNALDFYLEPVAQAIVQLQDITDWLVEISRDDAYAIGAASVDYLEMFGLVSLGYMWLRMAAVALNQADDGFYQAKLQTAQFYMQRVLPKVDSLFESIKSGSNSLMNLAVDGF